jgi:hypothetical protein
VSSGATSTRRCSRAIELRRCRMAGSPRRNRRRCPLRRTSAIGARQRRGSRPRPTSFRSDPLGDDRLAMDPRRRSPGLCRQPRPVPSHAALDGLQRAPPPRHREQCSTFSWNRWRRHQTPRTSKDPIRPLSRQCSPEWRPRRSDQPSSSSPRRRVNARTSDQPELASVPRRAHPT